MCLHGVFLSSPPKPKTDLQRKKSGTFNKTTWRKFHQCRQYFPHGLFAFLSKDKHAHLKERVYGAKVSTASILFFQSSREHPRKWREESTVMLSRRTLLWQELYMLKTWWDFERKFQLHHLSSTFFLLCPPLQPRGSFWICTSRVYGIHSSFLSHFSSHERPRTLDACRLKLGIGRRVYCVSSASGARPIPRRLNLLTGTWKPRCSCGRFANFLRNGPGKFEVSLGIFRVTKEGRASMFNRTEEAFQVSPTFKLSTDSLGCEIVIVGFPYLSGVYSYFEPIKFSLPRSIILIKL